MFAGLAVIAPDAEAGGYSRRYYDHGYSSYGHRSYYDDCRPRYRVYHAPVRYYSRSYYDHCGPRYYSSRPRFSFSFGF